MPGWQTLVLNAHASCQLEMRRLALAGDLLPAKKLVFVCFSGLDAAAEAVFGADQAA